MWRNQRQGCCECWKSNILATLLSFTIVAAGVGRIDATLRAVPAKAQGAVGEATVLRLILGSLDALAARKRFPGEMASSEVGANQVSQVLGWIGAHFPIGRDERLTLGVLGASIGAKWNGLFLTELTWLD